MQSSGQCMRRLRRNIRPFIPGVIVLLERQLDVDRPCTQHVYSSRLSMDCLRSHRTDRESEDAEYRFSAVAPRFLLRIRLCSKRLITASASWLSISRQFHDACASLHRAVRTWPKSGVFWRLWKSWARHPFFWRDPWSTRVPTPSCRRRTPRTCDLIGRCASFPSRYEAPCHSVRSLA